MRPIIANKAQKLFNGFMSKKKVLIIDDDKNLTALFKMVLETKYQVLILNEAVRAKVSAKQFQPDLVVMDMYMPDIAGDALAAEFESDPAVRDIPIVFLSAAIPENHQDGHLIDNRAHLSKPIVLQDFVQFVEKTLG